MPWQIRFLKDASSYFQTWRTSKLLGLTSQTFTAFIQTTSALSELSEHILEKPETPFRYVMLGKCQSDPIEGRFGRYRQLCGANFYVSVRQMLESEQKIRILNLMQQHVDLRELRRIDDQNHADDVEVPVWLHDLFLQIDVLAFETIDSDILNVLYFISGYIARSITHFNKCSSCMELLKSRSDSQEDFLCNFDLPDYQSLFDEANRGGLCAPTDVCFTIVLLSFIAFDYLKSSDTWETFLCIRKHRNVFINAVCDRCENDSRCSFLKCCQNDHAFFKTIVLKLFNCMVKNVCKDINAPHVIKTPDRKLRKFNI